MTRTRRLAPDIKEAVVGFLVIASAGMLFFSPFRDVGASTSDDAIITATFNRIDGLNLGDPVRLGGIQIGIVEAMTLDSRYRAVVTMRVGGDIGLPADTSAAIHTDGLFGSKFLVLEPGGDDAVLKTGESIRFTQDAMIVSNLLDLIIGQGHARIEKEKACGCDNSGAGTK